jgi:tRNA dimethylallyltransferase
MTAAKSISPDAMNSHDAMKKPLAISLMGPTASGKTDLALALVDKFPQLALISVDSSLVYRGMDIGSAKPNRETLEKYPHQLIDIRNADEPYSASDFRNDALTEMHCIWDAGKVPLLVGGTMMYFKVLEEGIADMPEANQEIRQSIVEKANREGWEAVHNELKEVDPKAAERIHPNDSQRLQRALEVYRLTGRSMSDFLTESAWGNEKEQPFLLESLALMTDNRALLHQRIEQRFELMLKAGFVDEVRELKKLFPGQSSLPAMRAVGYRQVWQYLDGEFDEQEMIQRGVAATRQLAKRQITWLRSWPNLQSFDIEEPDLFSHLAKKVSDLLEIEC